MIRGDATRHTANGACSVERSDENMKLVVLRASIKSIIQPLYSYYRECSFYLTVELQYD